MGTLWAISDIHGCHNALARLLERVNPGPDDLLVVLGNVVDRGPDSRLVVETLLGLRQDGLLLAIKGNHEEMLLDAARDDAALERWLAEGGDATLASYSPLPDAGRLEDIPEEHLTDFFAPMAEYYESESHIFVHAGVDPNAPMPKQVARQLRWEGCHDPREHRSGKTVICGHTQQPFGSPAHYGHTICIDTAAFATGGWLTALAPETGQMVQSNQAGDTRDGRIGNEDP